MAEKKGMRLILFPLPFQGHITPMLQLAQILYSKGFSITILHTNFNSLNPSNHPNFTFRSIPDGLTASDIPTGNIIHNLNSLNTRFVEPFRNCLAELLKQEEPVGCLLTDAQWHFTQGVADGFQIRRIVVRTGNISAFLAMLALPDLHRKGLLPSTEAKMEEPVPDFPILKMKDLPAFKTQYPNLLDHVFSSVLKETKASSGLIFNSFEELEEEPLLRCRQVFSPIPIFPLGPFHKQIPPSFKGSSLLTQDQASISWLDTRPPKSVLYASFGSVAVVDRHEFVEMAWGLANCNHPFLWVVRPGMVSGSHWVEALPEGFTETVGDRGCIVKWAPQQEVLAHPAVGAFWTHSGWNSTIESICEGVPMLCRPCFGDQMVNARYVSHVWGIGVVLGGSKLERGEIEKAIGKVMVERENGGMIKRMKGLKEKVDCSLEEGGSSFKSLENLIKYILNI